MTEEQIEHLRKCFKDKTNNEKSNQLDIVDNNARAVGLKAETDIAPIRKGKNHDGIKVKIDGRTSVLEIFNNLSELDLRMITLRDYTIVDKLSEYRGSKYWGYKGNPYYLLVSAKPDENNDVIVHPDTFGVASDAFYSETPYLIYWRNDDPYPVHSLTLNNLIIGENIDSYIDGICDVKCNYLEIKSYSRYFTYRNIEFLANSAKYIYAPKFLLGEFRYKSVKPNLVAGFLLKYRTDADLSEEVKQSYFKYIKLKYKDLSDRIVDYPEILDYLIENKILQAGDYYDLDKITKDKSDLHEKIEKYYSDSSVYPESLEIPDWRILTRQNLQAYADIDCKAYVVPPAAWQEDRIEIVCALGRIIKIDRRDFPDKSIPIQRKLITYMSSYLHLGDIFLGVYKNEIIKLKLIKLPTRYKERAVFEICDLTLENDETHFQNPENLPVIINNEVDILQESIICKAVYLQERSTDDGHFLLYLHLGLFKTNVYEGKVEEVVVFSNSHDFVIDSRLRALFQPYFYIPVPRSISQTEEQEYIFFRKDYAVADGDDEDKYSKYFLMPHNDLLVDINEYECAVQLPYECLRISDKDVFKSRSGVEYNLVALLLTVNSLLIVKGRDVNERMVCTYIRTYKNYNGVDYSFLTSEDVKVILSKYFHINIGGLFFPGYDSYFSGADDFYFYENKWLNIFFNVVKKNAETAFKKNSEIIRYVHMNDRAYFKLFAIPLEDFEAFVELAHKSGNYDVFLQVIKNYLINRTDENKYRF